MIIDVGLLLASVVIILLGAEVFTNGIEWLGKKLHLSEGAIGSVLAAVGTAMPETLIPVIAIVFGTGEAGDDIGIGAILGAPFMLATLAMCVTGLATIAYRRRRTGFPLVNVDVVVMRRDLGFFLVVYTLAMMAAFLDNHVLKQAVAIVLVILYGTYVVRTVRQEKTTDEDQDLSPLFLARKNLSPSVGIILVQVAVSLGLIISGAHLFVGGVEHLAAAIGIPTFVLALIIAPVATELPEKFNSVIWISKRKDTLALGNITGAMVFQSSLVTALGITLTDWHLETGALISAVLALASAGLVYGQLRLRGRLTTYTLLAGGLFYTVFIVLVAAGVIK